MYFMNAIHDKDDIFPLSEIEFEGYNFKCPCNTINYIKRIYGDNYMLFPKSGVEHHTYKGIKMGDIAKHNSQNMGKICDELKRILEEI